jgi:eukaryotic-like serine/threonine-protein kinase
MVKPHGSRLGSYEILALIGVGGMGEVYRARDTRLERDVAIKFLPEEVTANAERRARFEREAKLLASLNHRNIAAIYGLEESPDGTSGLVLELVDGSTLAERLFGGALPLPEALAVAAQIADALSAAHEHGIVHRDLKPQNIKIKHDGSVKVLDFGIAKTLEHGPHEGHDSSPLPTVTSNNMTLAGTVLGTPAYMSPEQTHGRNVDKRADVWAFGCVLYEMLTGKRAFAAEDVPGTIAAVLRGEPDWSLLPAEVPSAVQMALRRCLEKEPGRRLRDIGDLRILIEDSAARREAPVRRSSAPVAGRRRGPLVAAGVVGALGLVLAVAFYLRSVQPPAAASNLPSATPAQAAPVASSPERLQNSIAVLPLENLSPNLDDAYFATGLHEEILNQLAKLRRLTVISRTSVLRYADSRPPIPEIAEQLRVEAVMEGSVRYAGNQLMVTAQLIDPDTDSHLWSETFRADRGNIDELFAIQVEIATAIANALGAEITAEDHSRIARVPTESASAYASYLRATDHLTRARFGEAVQELDLAIAQDPRFAEAYAQRAFLYAYGQITSAGRSQFVRDGRLRNADFQALALADATHALELYEGAALAWVARAVTHMFHLRYREANDAYARALTLSPNDPLVLSDYAAFRLFQGDGQDALSLMSEAVRSDPNGALTLYYLTQTLLVTGRPAEAAAALEKSLMLEPTFLSSNALAGGLAGDAAAAERRVRATEQLGAAEPGGGWVFIAVAAQYWQLGFEREAEAAFERYAEWANANDVGAAEWAQYYLLRGDMDRAYEWLERAVAKLESGEADAGFFALQTSFIAPEAFGRRPDPRLEEPRFQRLLDRLKALIV